MKRYPPEAIWRHGLIPAAVLTLYFLIFSFSLPRLLPEYDRTVSTVFVSRAGKFSFLLTAAALLAFLAGLRLNRGSTIRVRHHRDRLSPADLILVLVPLTPIVQYLITNQDILSPSGALLVLAAFAFFSLLLVIGMPLVLGGIGSGRTLMILGMTFAFLVNDLAALSARFRWFEAGSLKIQLVIFSAVFGAAWLLYRQPAGRKLAGLFAAVFFLSNGAVHLATQARGGTEMERGGRESRLAAAAGSRLPRSTPNIYLLVYDSYVVNETMLGYGIDNSAQEDRLRQLGFKIYPHTYTVGEYTIPSMSRVLEASAEYPGSRRRGVSGSGTVPQLLKRYGYETCGIFQSDRFFQKIGSGYDSSFPAVNDRATPRLLVKAILMGEFRFDVVFDRPSREQFVKRKLSTFAAVSPRPRFVYMHDYLPGHSQISGRCLPDETELFRERLAEANRQIDQDIAAIIRADPVSLIIVAGDHGPYLTKNCIGTGGDYDLSEIARLDIQDRFGTFLAIRWPDENYTDYDEITVLQDIFPAIFAYLFRDRDLLAAKIPPRTLSPETISGAEVRDGVIHGGINDGEPLFLTGG